MPTLPAICRVVYDTDPPTLDPDDDPFIPYRFSFQKSYSSSNSSFGRIGKGHARYHGNYRHVTDNQESVSMRDRWRLDKAESGRFSRRNDGERSDGYGVDLSRWITEEDFLDVDPGPLIHCGGMTAAEAEDKLLESEDGWKHPRKATRMLWDPINNTWISQDPNSLVYLHFVNALSLADRGIHSNRTVLERRARFYPCMERHLKSLDEVRRMTGANASAIWVKQHLKRRAPSSQHRRDFPPTTKDFTYDEPKYRSGHTSNSSSSSTGVIRGSLIAAKKDDDIKEKGRNEEADEDSARGRSAATGSDEGPKQREDEEEEEEETAALNEDRKSSSVAGNQDIEADVDDFISLDGHTGASDDNYSDVGRGDDWSGSGSTRASLQQIEERRQDFTDDESEILPDRHTIEQKIRQMKEKEKRGGDGKVLEKDEGRLRTIRGRTNRQRKEEDSDEDRDTDETRTRRQMQEREFDDSSLTPTGSLSNGRLGHRISRAQIPLPSIDAERRPDPAAAASGGRRHPMRRRPSWLQRMQRKQARRGGGMLRQTIGANDEDNGEIDLRFEDYDWLAKYCILDPKTVTICKQIFDEVDENDVGRLSCHQTMVALRASNYKLTDMLEQYMYKIMELTGYEIENGSDYRLFSVLAALSQRITAVDDWMKCLINKMDMKTLEAKLFVCKTLWECSVDTETKTLSLDDLCVELRAGGVSMEHEQHVRQKLQHLRRLDLLDFLTYVPLFIMIHESVVENPFDDRRYK